MTGYEKESVLFTDERRLFPGIALISHRQITLAERLVGSMVRHRHIATPRIGAAALLDGVRPPILLDAHGMSPDEIVDILCEVAHTRRPLTTVAMVRPGDTLALRLASACPTVPVVLADSVDNRVLLAWLRQAEHLSLRDPPDIPPALVGLHAPLRPIPVTMTVLQILRALRPAYGSAPETMEVAATHSAFSRRMFFYQLAALRSMLQIDPDRRYRPEDLATIIFDRLSE